MNEQFKEGPPDVLASLLEAVRGEIKALRAQVVAQDAKIETIRRELTAEVWRIDEKYSAELRRLDGKYRAELRRLRRIPESDIRRVEQRLESDIRHLDQSRSIDLRRVEDSFSANFAGLEGRLDIRLQTTNDRLESTRREILAVIKAAERVAGDKAA